MSGKGSGRRPQSVSDEEFGTLWDNIFKKDKEDANLETDERNEGAGDDTNTLESVSSSG